MIMVRISFFLGHLPHLLTNSKRISVLLGIGIIIIPHHSLIRSRAFIANRHKVRMWSADSASPQKPQAVDETGIPRATSASADGILFCVTFHTKPNTFIGTFLHYATTGLDITWCCWSIFYPKSMYYVRAVMSMKVFPDRTPRTLRS